MRRRRRAGNVPDNATFEDVGQLENVRKFSSFAPLQSEHSVNENNSSSDTHQQNRHQDKRSHNEQADGCINADGQKRGYHANTDNSELGPNLKIHKLHHGRFELLDVLCFVHHQFTFRGDLDVLKEGNGRTVKTKTMLPHKRSDSPFSLAPLASFTRPVPP